MLYAFHSTQTTKNPGCLTATYLLCGTIPPASTKTQRSAVTDGDNDVMMMESSPPPSSWMDDSGTPAATQVEDPGEDYDPADSDVPLTHIVMVREEELEEVKAEFEEIQWIHVYSLQPSSPTDMHVISAANDIITKSYIKSIAKDPQEPLRDLGTIVNEHAVWRDVQNTTTGSSKVVKPVATATTVTTKTIPTLSRESSSKSKPAPPKGKASIMSSFAKTPKVEAKPKKEDVTMKNTPNFSDDEDEDEDEIDEAALRAAEDSVVKAAAAREAKAARKEKLNALMDSDSDDDVEMSDAPAKPSNGAYSNVKEEADPTSEDDEDDEQEAVDDSAALDANPVKEEPDQEEVVTTANGRNRGKRRVMKKLRYKDEDGCLVTKEEMVWESYSEDEQKPEAKRPRPNPPAPSKKKGAPGGPNKQVNIMAFFGKK
jgi:DNA polymerase delta subunit 3